MPSTLDLEGVGSSPAQRFLVSCCWLVALCFCSCFLLLLLRLLMLLLLLFLLLLLLLSLVLLFALLLLLLLPLLLSLLLLPLLLPLLLLLLLLLVAVLLRCVQQHVPRASASFSEVTPQKPLCPVTPLTLDPTSPKVYQP